MKQAAFILCLLSTISFGFLIIPLFWCVPMTAKIYKGQSEGEYLSSGFKLCVLLFVNVIAGILLLCDES